MTLPSTVAEAFECRGIGLCTTRPSGPQFRLVLHFTSLYLPSLHLPKYSAPQPQYILATLRQNGFKTVNSPSLLFWPLSETHAKAIHPQMHCFPNAMLLFHNDQTAPARTFRLWRRVRRAQKSSCRATQLSLFLSRARQEDGFLCPVCLYSPTPVSLWQAPLSLLLLAGPHVIVLIVDDSFGVAHVIVGPCHLRRQLAPIGEFASQLSSPR